MLNFEENVIINDENDIGSDQETNCSYSEHSNRTPSIEIASMSSTISTLNTTDHALISTKVIDNSCNKQEQLMNLLNSDFLSCSFCHANDNVIKVSHLHLLSMLNIFDSYFVQNSFRIQCTAEDYDHI